MPQARTWLKGAAPSEGEAENDEHEQMKSWPVMAAGIFASLCCVYIFLVGLELFGDSFRCLGGRGAGEVFGTISNPIAGLMAGILATVLVQSSSISTSITVGLVGAEVLDVKAAIPVIMGANVGTSVANTLVSIGQLGDSLTLQRAFSGATVHDMFNMLTVVVLLPIEVLVGSIQGEGGPLYWIAKGFTLLAVETGRKHDDPMEDKSPTKFITSPVAQAVISNNKFIINALALGAPAAMPSAWVNQSFGCKPLGTSRRLDSGSSTDGFRIVGGGAGATLGSTSGRGLEETQELDCSAFYCVGKDLDDYFKGIDEVAYSALLSCETYVSKADLAKCGTMACYLNAAEYYKSQVEQRRIIQGGFTAVAGDVAGGMISLSISLVLLMGGLISLCAVLKFLFLGAAKRTIIKSIHKMNDFVAIAVGIWMTIIVQSSSVTTSALTPLCGIGVLPLSKMLPVTLGANIGTTVTPLFASLSTLTPAAVHIALCHLFFNIIGIFIWFPLPIMRRVPLEAAKLLGLYASSFRLFPAVYVLVVFVIIPAILLGVSTACEANLAGGVALTALLVSAVLLFERWWICCGGCYKVLSEEVRHERRAALEAVDRPIAAESDASRTPAAATAAVASAHGGAAAAAEGAEGAEEKV